MRATILDGTGVTLTGEIQPPARGMLAARVALRVGEAHQTLVARGARRWVRAGADLVPSAPEPWTPLEMDWSEAFGGTERLEPGRDPATGLPRPAVTVADPRNPLGKGFALAPAPREGQPLPRLELIDQQLDRWSHSRTRSAPTPGCFAPCNDVPGMGAGTAPPPADGVRPHSFLATHQVAPWYLVLPTVAAGTRCVALGMGAHIDFLVPPPRVAVLAAGKPRGARIGTRLRALHVDARSRRAFLVWHHVVTTAGTMPDLQLRHAEGSEHR